LPAAAARPTLPPVIRKPHIVRQPGADYSIRVIGDYPTLLRDFYHALLRMPWPATVASIAIGFLAANALFAVGFLLTGGIANARPGSFADAFFFSIQTMGTIGYGAMHPQSLGANLLVVGEAITGLTITALATGLVFAKFSRSTARVAFTREAVISPVNGVPTLTFRMSNQRGNQIVDAQIRVVLSRTERTQEGRTFYRLLDLKLTRERALSLSRSWTVFHIIDGASPLHGLTPAAALEQEIELSVLVVGLDDTSMQLIHASHHYYGRQILWGARHTDVLSEDEAGDLVLDLRKFHEIEPTPPTDDFPYQLG
jgi:inward rectifier potassium channel